MRICGIVALGVLATIVTAAEQDFAAAERRIARLPPRSFPSLPTDVIRDLERRGYTIPQEGISGRPNNVVRGEFARPGQADWAVLCSIHGSSSILVYWNGTTRDTAEIARREDRIYLQGVAADRIEFSRGISAVDSETILMYYRAFGGPKPPPLDHQGIDDAFLEKASTVQYFYRGKWYQLTGSD